MNSLDDANTKGSFGVCSRGKNRWFWVAIEPGYDFLGWWEDSYTYKPLSGYEPTKEAAIETAKRMVGADDPYQWAAQDAESYHKFQVKRTRKPNEKATDTTPAEYVYSFYWSDDWTINELQEIECRIAKKTKSRVYVLRRDDEEETFVLDRHELETTGEAVSRHQWPHIWYTKAGLQKFLDEQRQGSKPACFEILGIDYPATIDQIKRAYRLKAKDLHPDTGGNEADFVKLKDAYDTALNMAATHGNGGDHASH